MGSGKSYSHKEIGSTRGAASDAAFDQIIEKLELAGAEMIKDETSPLYIDLGPEEHEVGTIRELEFNLAKMDFRIIREVKNFRVVGQGKIKSLENLDQPMVDVKLYKKPEIESEWLVVDLEELL